MLPETCGIGPRHAGWAGMETGYSDLSALELVLYTDALIARGTIRTRQHRISDILNLSETPFLVLEEVRVTDLDGQEQPIEADVAQINLDTVLFAVTNTPVSTMPEMRTPKMQREAIISVPPFRVTGTLHLQAGAANLREAITDLTERFLPVTEAEVSSAALGIGPERALMVAVNHRRAQIFARYTLPGDRPMDVTSAGDPWANQHHDTLQS